MLRMARELGLDRRIPEEPSKPGEACLMRNRLRAWLFCFNLDRWLGILHGVEPVIDNADYVATHIQVRWSAWDDNAREFDAPLVLWTMLSLAMGRFRGYLGQIAPGSDEVGSLHLLLRCS